MFKKNIKAIKTAATWIEYTTALISGLLIGSLINCILYGGANMVEIITLLLLLKYWWVWIPLIITYGMLTAK